MSWRYGSLRLVGREDQAPPDPDPRYRLTSRLTNQHSIFRDWPEAGVLFCRQRARSAGRARGGRETGGRGGRGAHGWRPLPARGACAVPRPAAEGAAMEGPPSVRPVSGFSQGRFPKGDLPASFALAVGTRSHYDN